MRAVLFLACLALAVGASVNSEVIARLGKTIPLHIPTQTITVNETFEVPYWLGAYYATVAIPSNWTLPLTIGSGGQTYPGEFLIVRNYGPESITLTPTTPETIEGVSSYVIPSGTVAEILSGYPNWVVATPSSDVNVQDLSISGDVYYHDEGPLDLGSLGYIYTFYNESEDTIRFTVAIVPGVPNSPQPDSVVNWNSVNIGTQAGEGATGDGNNNHIGAKTGFGSTGKGCNNLGTRAGEGSANSYQNNLGWLAGYGCAVQDVNNIGRESGRNTTGFHVNNMGFQAGAFSSGLYSSHNGFMAGINNTFNFCYTNGPNSVCSAANQFVFGTADFPLHLRLPSNSGSFCMGAAYDTCLSYGRTGGFTLPFGHDLYSTGYTCFGTGCTSAAPAPAAIGVYDSNTRVVRSCTAGAGITCSVTDGVLTVSATAPELQSLQTLQGDNETLKKRVELLEARLEKLLQLLGV